MEKTNVFIFDSALNHIGWENGQKVFTPHIFASESIQKHEAEVGANANYYIGTPDGRICKLVRSNKDTPFIALFINQIRLQSMAFSHVYCQKQTLDLFRGISFQKILIVLMRIRQPSEGVQILNGWVRENEPRMYAACMKHAE